MPLLNQIRKRLKTRLGNNFRDYYQARREILKQLPFTETAAKIGKNLVFVAVVLSVAWLLKIFYSTTQITTSTDNYAAAANLVTSTPTIPSPDLSPLEISQDSLGLTRKAELHTDVPSRGREGVITYTVKVGDTLFGISDKFGIKPETLLWGNQYVLGDNPHNLRPGQEINILPVDGTYHRWSEGDGQRQSRGYHQFSRQSTRSYHDWRLVKSKY